MPKTIAPSIADLVAIVAGISGREPAEIISNRSNARLRAIVAFFARRYNYPTETIAAQLNISISSVNLLIRALSISDDTSADIRHIIIEVVSSLRLQDFPVPAIPECGIKESAGSQHRAPRPAWIPVPKSMLIKPHKSPLGWVFDQKDCDRYNAAIRQAWDDWYNK